MLNMNTIAIPWQFLSILTYLVINLTAAPFTIITQPTHHRSR